MACGHAGLSSDSPNQNLARSLLDFTTDNSPSITKVSCTGMSTEATLKSLGLAWSGDLESLKTFVSKSLKLNGTWSQPGGDKKVFTGKNVSDIWRKNKNLLAFEGVKANQVKKKVCRLMCDYPSKSPDASVEFENLKHGQLLNGKTIQELSDTVKHIDAVISQFQDFMEKNRSNSEEKSSLREKSHAAIAKECVVVMEMMLTVINLPIQNNWKQLL